MGGSLEPNFFYYYLVSFYYYSFALNAKDMFTRDSEIYAIITVTCFCVYLVYFPVTVSFTLHNVILRLIICRRYLLMTRIWLLRMLILVINT